MLCTTKLNKKGMSFKIIIFLILAVIVVLIISSMLNKSGRFLIANAECASTGGKCVNSPSDCDGEISGIRCENKEQYCCQSGWYTWKKHR